MRAFLLNVFASPLGTVAEGHRVKGGKVSFAHSFRGFAQPYGVGKAWRSSHLLERRKSRGRNRTGAGRI